jgi:Domain of unknown function (DUF4332)
MRKALTEKTGLNADGILMHSRMSEVNTQKSLTRRVPTAEQLERWIAEAKTMPRMVEH